MISEIRKLKSNEVLVAMIAFLAVVGPGFLTIYHYHVELVRELDVVKLLLFSASLTCPLVVVNLGFIVAGTPDRSEQPKKAETLLMACFFAIPTYYGTLLLAWFFHWPFGQMLKSLLCFAVGMGVGLFFAVRGEYKSRPKA